MNLTEWCLFSIIVLLWLHTLSLSHRITVLRQEHEYHLSDPFKHWSREVRLTGSDWRRVWTAIHDKADARTCGEINESIWAELSKKADKPLLRRATDKKPKGGR